MSVIDTSHLCKLNFFFFNDTATTEIYTLSLHDALPIFRRTCGSSPRGSLRKGTTALAPGCLIISSSPVDPSGNLTTSIRSEEHTSELQSQSNLVCRLLLEKKKEINHHRPTYSN